MKTVYPVLSNCPIRVGDFLHTQSNVHPSVSWPGTEWEAYHGKFLFAEDDAHAVGSTGGELTHTLTVDEMPKHRHQLTDEYRINIAPGRINVAKGSDGYVTPRADKAESYIWGNGYVGNSAAHNNMPPYEAVYIYKRTA